MSEMLSKCDLPGDVTQCASSIRNSSRNLLGIVDDILDFSKMEADRIEIRDDPFSLSMLANEVSSLFAASAIEQGIQFTVEVLDGVPDLVAGDHARIRQVIVNMVSNALKFTEHGTVTVRISRDGRDRRAGDPALLRGKTWREPDPPLNTDSQIRFEVIDTGIGMNTEQLQRVFDKFEQADSSIGKRFGGTGLGLAICCRLVQLMGGTIGGR